VWSRAFADCFGRTPFPPPSRFSFLLVFCVRLPTWNLVLYQDFGPFERLLIDFVVKLAIHRFDRLPRSFYAFFLLRSSPGFVRQSFSRTLSIVPQSLIVPSRVSVLENVCDYFPFFCGAPSIGIPFGRTLVSILSRFPPPFP